MDMGEKPVECSHCKKPTKVIYKEIVGDVVTCTEMCAECPLLQQKLHGEATVHEKGEALMEKEGTLYCGYCHTSLESMKMGNPLGCAECYSVFADVLIEELTHADKVPLYWKKVLSTKKTQPIHIGKTPHKPVNIPSSSRLTALNEALNEALKIENYEQAAWLRDQIKALTEKTDEKKE